MKLKKLLQDVEVVKVYGNFDIEASGVVDDSHKVEKGNMFVAIPGLRVDGHDYISKAVEAGVGVIVGEQIPKKEWLGATYIQVKDARSALSFIASNWYGQPSKKLKVIGVTGTDGKTTTANIIYHLLNTAGKKVGLVTTINAIIGDKKVSTGLHVTNPEPIELHKILRKMVDGGLKYVVLEVTSHGLHQKRVSGIEFEVAVLTNITHEHLDYHNNYKEYRDIKAKLFKRVNNLAVLNKDDQNYKYVKQSVPEGVEIITYSTKEQADFRGKLLSTTPKCMNYKITQKGRSFLGRTNLVGVYNLQNVLAAVGVANYYGVRVGDIASALENVAAMPGRMEEIENDRGIRIVVDFAHTPNSLEKVLTELRKTTEGNLIAVFGCAGERDKEKRKLMPRKAVKITNESIFTAEDPRSEEVQDILDVMEKSVSIVKGAKYQSIKERGEAIYTAINEIAKKGDTVAILGKGHEKSMAYGGVEYPWSDQEAVKDALKGKVINIDRS